MKWEGRAERPSLFLSRYVEVRVTERSGQRTVRAGPT